MSTFIYRFNELEGKNIALVGNKFMIEKIENYISIMGDDISIKFIIYEGEKLELKTRIPIVTPSEFKATGNMDDIDYILVCSFCYSAFSYMQDMNTILNLNTNNYKVLSDLLAHTIASYFDVIVEDSFNNLDKYLDKYPIIESMLSPEDFILFRHLINLRCDYKNKQEEHKELFKNIAKDGELAQYLDFIKYDKIEYAIEGGACNTFTSYMFQEKFPNLKKLYGFEGFKHHYEESYIYNNLVDKNKVEIVNKVLLDKKQDCHFKDLQGASKVSLDDNDVIVQSISIDEFVQENNIPKIDFIKLDIEGAELVTLKGAKNTLQKYRPQLAISIYHSHAEMIDIPVYLNSILDNYEWKLSHYTFCQHETLLTGIPKEII